MQRGAKVIVHGLTSAAGLLLNNKHGKLGGPLGAMKPGRYPVFFNGEKGYKQIKACNVRPAWDVHCSEPLAAYIATPHGATHGMWTAAQHTCVKRAIFLRSFRFAQRRLGAAGASPHLRALSEVANWRNVMRTVLRFAVPHCTPTRAERQAICTMCHTSDATVGLARWLRCGVDPNTVDVDGDSVLGMFFFKAVRLPLLKVAAAGTG